MVDQGTKKQGKKCLAVGTAGAGITALCCLTPLLVVVLGGLGLSAALAWADYVLLPIFGMFLLLMAHGIRKIRAARAS